MVPLFARLINKETRVPCSRFRISLFSAVGVHLSNDIPLSGFQISLNYLMEFNAKLSPNSSRIPNECDLLCARTYNYICCFCWLLASAKRVALLFGGCLGKVRPALRYDL